MMRSCLLLEAKPRDDLSPPVPCDVKASLVLRRPDAQLRGSRGVSKTGDKCNGLFRESSIRLSGGVTVPCIHQSQVPSWIGTRFVDHFLKTLGDITDS